MCQLDPSLEPNRISGSDSIRKGLGTHRKLTESSNIMMKNEKKVQQGPFGQFQDTTPSPQLIASFSRPTALEGSQAKIPRSARWAKEKADATWTCHFLAC